MKRKSIGHYEIISTVGEKCKAFVPQPLPPSPPVQIDGELRDLLDQAMIALGRLDGMSTLLPDPSLFLYMYIRKEAVLSSQIEGTQSSLTDLLLFEDAEIPGVPVDDVQEVRIMWRLYNMDGAMRRGSRYLCDCSGRFIGS